VLLGSIGTSIGVCIGMSGGLVKSHGQIGAIAQGNLS
jgi:hypothetical protein